MPGDVLTVGATVQCPHGGRAVLMTSNTRVSGKDGPVLLESDVHLVLGCPFTVGPKYSPCVRIQWSAPATQTNANGVQPLVETSIGMCIGAEGGPQGIAIVASTQRQVSSR
jgi:hypothetical protein